MNIDYSKVKKITINAPLKLDCGETLEKFDIAYETYGNLDETKSNAIFSFSRSIRRSVCNWYK